MHVIADAEERAGTRRYSIQICPPKGLRHAYGKYECRLTIGEGGDGPSARTDFVLMVQPCVRARGRPKLRVSASGALSVSVPLFNCSGVDLSASFELVPKRGSPQRWDFDLKSDPPFFEYQLDDINGHYRWFARFGLNVTAEDVFVLKQRVSFFSAGSRVRRWISDLPSKVIGIVLALIVGAAATVIGILLAHTSPARISVPTHIDCGTAAVYGQAICPSIVVTNVGSGVVTLGRVVSASAAFAVSSTTCTRPLAPNSTCHVAVTFDPPATGLTTGLVTIGRGSLARSSDVVLTGVGESLGSAPKFTSAASGGFEGTFVVTSTGQPTPTLSVLGALPSWLHFSTIRGGDALLSGTPPAGTSGPVTVRLLANNGVQPEATQTLVLEVSNVIARSAPKFTSAASGGFEGTFVVTSTGQPTPTLSVLGALPSWLHFSTIRGGDALLSGTPPAGTSGPVTVRVLANNGVQPEASQNLVLEVAAPRSPPTITERGRRRFPRGQLDDLRRHHRWRSATGGDDNGDAPDLAQVHANT